MPKEQAASNVAADKKMMVRRAVADSIFLIGGGG